MWLCLFCLLSQLNQKIWTKKKHDLSYSEQMHTFLFTARQRGMYIWQKTSNFYLATSVTIQRINLIAFKYFKDQCLHNLNEFFETSSENSIFTWSFWRNLKQTFCETDAGQIVLLYTGCLTWSLWRKSLILFWEQKLLTRSNIIQRNVYLLSVG